MDIGRGESMEDFKFKLKTITPIWTVLSKKRESS